MSEISDLINAEYEAMIDAEMEEASSSYSSDNARVIMLELKRYTKEVFKPLLINVLKKVAQRIVAKIDGAFTPWSKNPDGKLPSGGNVDFPVWYGQMHDATGVAIYDDGQLMQYLPTKKALDKQSQSHDGETGIIGSEYLKTAIQEGMERFGKGLYMVLFCAVPYAVKIEAVGSSKGRGAGFFTTITDDMFEDILVGINTLKPL